MDVERNQSHTFKMIASNLNYIREETESKSSSVIMNDDENDDGSHHKKKDRAKIHFGDVMEKQFIDEQNECQEEEEEVDDQPYLQQDEYVPTVQDIRQQISARKSMIKEAERKIRDQRLNYREKIRCKCFYFIQIYMIKHIFYLFAQRCNI